MQKQSIFITTFIMRSGEENAYRTYRQRIDRLSEVEGVAVISASQGLRQVGKEALWESLADQYQIEYDGEYPDDHVLCKVLTVVKLSETAYFNQVSELLLMDDPAVDVGRYPSFASTSFSNSARPASII